MRSLCFGLSLCRRAPHAWHLQRVTTSHHTHYRTSSSHVIIARHATCDQTAPLAPSMAATPPTLSHNCLLNCYKNTPWEARSAPQVLAAILLLPCARARISSVISFGVLNVLLLLNFSWPAQSVTLFHCGKRASAGLLISAGCICAECYTFSLREEGTHASMSTALISALSAMSSAVRPALLRTSTGAPVKLLQKVCGGRGQDKAPLSMRTLKR